MCPVMVLWEYLELRGHGPEPLLMHEEGFFLSRFQFVQVFRRCVAKPGLLEREYSSHSFRFVAATVAARWGLSPEVVKRIGHWESDWYCIYIRPHLL